MVEFQLGDRVIFKKEGFEEETGVVEKTNNGGFYKIIARFYEDSAGNRSLDGWDRSFSSDGKHVRGDSKPSLFLVASEFDLEKFKNL